ncbi:MAG: proton-conducting transporter membrane subunit [Humidesulfovibrio sp.]|uniref:NADH-quinone oxidoreductase subunit 5 family protein n=1 Tax=Humidesulfovibrio sp. TaxID=2910988 RepID=UPI0027FAD975|nr:proton-conducting transporter membrane subunit [Humidesulfovibrio sp.]MDQ7834674.1 proton-conducting transporter membrane subunit [Humidesulfovibrio sp.]
MIDAYIGLLVLWPVAAGLACLVLRAPALRSMLVMATAAVLAAAAVGLATQAPLTASPAFLASATALHVAQAASFLFPVYFLLMGLKEKHPLVIVFALLQLGLAAFGEFGLAAPAEVKTAVVCDGLSLALVLVVSLVGSLISIFALPYMKHHEEHLHLKTSRQPQFFMILLAFLGFMNGLALSNNLHVFSAFYEATTLCSFLLIGHDQTADAKKSGLRALWMNSMGGVFLHAGILLIQKQHGIADIQALVSPALWTGTTLLPLALIAMAACVKAAQLPFQAWLLGAMVAPTPVSALLHSSTMVKVGVFVCLRLAPVFEGTSTGRVLTLAGAFTFLAASALALGQSNAKKILAYSTAANLGLIIACAGIGTPVAIAAGVVLMVIHACTKGLLFLCVGDMEQTIGSRDLEDLRGMIATSPVTALAASAGSMAMVLPPLGMLVGKWAALEAAAASPVSMVMMAVGSALGVVCWVRFTGTLMSGVSMGSKADPAAHTSSLSTGPILTMLAGAVGLGMAAPWLNAMLLPAGVGNALGGGWGLMPPLFITAMLAWIVGIKVLGRQSQAKLATPYIGGLPSKEAGSFVGALGRNWTLSEGNEYATEFFGEPKLTKLAGVVAVALLLALVGGALI